MKSSRLVQWCWFFACGLGCGAGVGAILGVLNGLIDPASLITLCCKEAFGFLPPNINIVAGWRLAVSLGLVHGANHGAVLGAIWAVLLGSYAVLVSRNRVVPRTLLAHPCLLVAGSLLFWVLGGLDSIVLTYWSFHGVPAFYSMPSSYLRFAWVPASIWGAYGGVAVSLLFACARWKRDYLRQMLALESRENSSSAGESVRVASGA